MDQKNKTKEQLYNELKEAKEKIKFLEKDVKSLRLSEKKYRDLSNQLPIGIYRTTPEGQIIYSNRSLAIILGYKTEEELLKANAKDFFVDIREREEQVKEWQDKYDILHTNEYRFRKKDGTVIWVRDTGTTQTNRKGEVIYFDGIIEDITDYKKATLALKENEEKYRSLTSQLPLGVYRTKKDGEILFANPSLVKILGYDNIDDLLSVNTSNLFADTSQREDQINNWKKSADIHSDELLFKRKDGKKIWVRDTGRAILNKNGEIDYFDGVIEDITKIKMAEEDVKKERNLVLTLINSIPNAIYVKNTKYEFILGNKMMAKELGVKNTNDFLGMTDFDFFETNRAMEFLQVDKKVIENGETVIDLEQYIYNEHHEKIWLLTTKVPLKDPKGKITGLVGINRDITQRKKMMEALKESEERFRQLAEMLPEIVFETDMKFNVTFCNQSALDKFGYSIDDFNKGIKIFDFVSKESREKMIGSIRDNLKGNHSSGNEYKVKRKNGEIFYIRIFNNPVMKDGHIAGLRGIAIDITEQRRINKQLIEAKERAEQADILKSAFLANMSHEIRTPLNSIIGFSQLLSQRQFNTEKRAKYSKLIQNNGRTLLKLIDDIIDISKIESDQMKVIPTKFKLNGLLEQLSETYELKLKDMRKEGIALRVRKSLPGEKSVIKADRDRLQQIYSNLLNNAIKFTNEGNIEFGYELNGENEILMFVKDTGIGIAKNQFKNIFKRFNQIDNSKTREHGGTGIGLAISKGLIEKMGGKIWVESEKGQGTVFWFRV